MTTINPFTGPNWPAEFQGCRITGHFVYSDGTPLAGKKLTLTPAPGVIIAPLSKFIVPSRPVSIVLSDDGKIRGTDGTMLSDEGIVVPATDDPDITPQGWTYTVTESWPGGRTYAIAAPQNTIIDLAQVAPVSLSQGLPAAVYTIFTADGNATPAVVINAGAAVPTNLPAGTLVYQKNS